VDCEKRQQFRKKTRWWSLSLISGLCLIAVVLVVGIMVVGKLDTVADAMALAESPITNQINATMWSSLYCCTTGAFNLAIIIPIVVGVAGLVALVVYFASKTLPDAKLEEVSVP